MVDRHRRPSSASAHPTTSLSTSLYRTLSAYTLNAAGGLTGLQFTIGGIDPNLVSPVTYTYSTGLDHEMGSHYVAGVAYSGSNGRKLLSGGGQVYNVSYGQDINELPGDLIIHNSTVPSRLNPNFGQVLYTQNDRVSNYNAFIASFEGAFQPGVLQCVLYPLLIFG